MIPIKDVFFVHENDKLSDVAALIYDQSFSRVLVVNIQKTIIGILYAKDLACPSKDVSVKTLMRKPTFTESEKDITDVFLEMQKKRIHLIIVKNTNNENIGIITMEDISENLLVTLKMSLILKQLEKDDVH